MGEMCAKLCLHLDQRHAVTGDAFQVGPPAIRLKDFGSPKKIVGHLDTGARTNLARSRRVPWVHPVNERALVCREPRLGRRRKRTARDVRESCSCCLTLARVRRPRVALLPSRSIRVSASQLSAGVVGSPFDPDLPLGFCSVAAAAPSIAVMQRIAAHEAVRIDLFPGIATPDTSIHTRNR